MASPDPERALEDETPAQPGARAGEPRGGDDEDFRKVAGEAGERAGRAAKGRLDPRGVDGRPAGEERVRGEAGAAHGGADALARDVTREAGRVADQREALAAEPPRLAAPDGVRVPAKGREGEVVRQPAGGERAGVARDLDAARDLAHLAHARALVQPGARRGRAPEEEGVELGAHDAVARGAVPVCLVLLLAGRDRDGRERLDGVRVRRRVELQVGERGVRDPAGAQLDAREARGVQDGDAGPRPREPPSDRAAPRSAPHHEDVGGRHTRSSPASTASRTPSGTRRRSIALAARMAAKMSPSMSSSPPMYASPKRSDVGRRTMRRNAPRERNTTAQPLSPVVPTQVVVPSQRRKVSGASRDAKTRRRSPAAAAARRSGGAEDMPAL